MAKNADTAAQKKDESAGKTPKESKEPAAKSAKGDRIDKTLGSKDFDEIRKKFGQSIIMRASAREAQRVPRIPSGVFPLDYALSGGFAAGYFHIVYGPKSAAKTTVYLKTIAEAQQMCATCWSYPAPTTGKCLCGKFKKPVIGFVDVEGTLDLPWAVKIGVNTDELILSTPEFAEQALDIGEALLRNGCDILIIDSIAFLSPLKEVEGSVGDEQMGIQARVLGRAVRKFVAALNAIGNEKGRRPTVLMTNQIRMKIGLVFGNPETQSGGLAPGFAAATETRLWSGEYEMSKETGRPISVTMKFRNDKNKTASPRMEGDYTLVLADTERKKMGEVYDEPYLIQTAIEHGLIKKSMSKVEYCGESFSSESRLEEKMVSDRAFNRHFRQTLLSVAFPSQTVVVPQEAPAVVAEA